MNLFEIITASAIGSSVGSATLDFIKEQIKESLTYKREIKKQKSEKILDKRIVYYEELYKIMDKMASISSDYEIIQVKLIEAEDFIKEKNLYIEEDAISIVYRFCDYFKEVINEEKARDLPVEDSFLKEYKDFFNQ